MDDVMQKRHRLDPIAPLVDITEALACRRHPGDSRQRYRLYAEWAQDFLADYAARAAAGRRPEETYDHDIAAFALRQALAYGFTDGPPAAGASHT